LFNKVAIEYEETTTTGDTGIPAKTYTRTRDFPLRVESITRELAERIYGYKEEVGLHVYSHDPLYKDRYLEIDGERYQVVKAMPIYGMKKVHHYEGLLQ